MIVERIEEMINQLELSDNESKKEEKIQFWKYQIANILDAKVSL